MDQSNQNNPSIPQPTPTPPSSTPLSKPVPDATEDLTPPHTPEPPATITTPIPATNYPNPPLTINSPVDTNDTGTDQLPKLTEGTEPVAELQISPEASSPTPPPVSGIDANPVLQDPLNSSLPVPSIDNVTITHEENPDPTLSSEPSPAVTTPPISLNNIDGVITTSGDTSNDNVPAPAVTIPDVSPIPESTLPTAVPDTSVPPSDLTTPPSIQPSDSSDQITISPELPQPIEASENTNEAASSLEDSTLSNEQPSPELTTPLPSPVEEATLAQQNNVDQNTTETLETTAIDDTPPTEPTDTSTEATPDDQPSPELQEPEPSSETPSPSEDAKTTDSGTVSESALSQKANAFGIDSKKPFFPINTMRLLYLELLTNYVGNTDAVKDQLQKAITAINALVDKRNSVIQSDPQTKPIDQMHQSIDEIKQLSDVIPTPTMRHEINNLFTENFPLQEKIMISLEARLKEESLNQDDLFTLLKIRSMDSVLYATAISEIIRLNQTEGSPLSLDEIAPQLHLAIDSTLQLNDLCDAVAYAKQDLESGSAPIIEVIKKIKSGDQRIKDLVRELSKKLTFTSTTDTKLTQLVIEYQAELLKTIGL